MTYSPNQPDDNGGLSSSARVIGALVVMLAALFGALVVLDVIALENAGEFAKKLALLTVIVVLAGGLIAVLLKSGKR
jgi:hypothetical protein